VLKHRKKGAGVSERDVNANNGETMGQPRQKKKKKKKNLEGGEKKH